MKKYFAHLFLTAFVVTAFIFNFSTPVASAQTQSMTISQFVELMITIGAVPADKVVAARAMVASLSKTIATSTPAVAIASSSLPYLQVLSPNGGENWNTDAQLPYTITWGSTSLVPVSIALVPVKGEVCTLTSNPVTSIKGNNSFSVLLSNSKCINNITGTTSPLVDGSYKVRVSYTSDGGVLVKDESDAVFKILPVRIPTIKVTSPNGSEKFVLGGTYDVKYTIQNSDELALRVSLVDYQGNTVYSINSSGNRGVYHLKIPTTINAGAYKVRLDMVANDYTNMMDMSDGFFWISDVN